ncbi:MAG: transporter substrate-binding domain-containing protein [Lachnospiraceae bacterium]|nr:transporter substrate-binding domain-containing protein [Lachnospiraceae bacterium]
MKKFVSIVLAALCMGATLVGCSKANANATDWEYIKNKNEMVVGITLYEPMNYYDENGKLIGFDTEFAEEVSKITGVPVKFQEIEWDQKEVELKSKAIDCIWNGLTVTEERKANMAFSTSYVVNEQVVVINKSNQDKYTSLADMDGIKVCAESGSAGESAIQADPHLSTGNYLGVSAQKDALLEVKAGTCDAAVLDLTLAKAVINEDTDYNDLLILYGASLQSEEYAIGFRLEDTETVKTVNDAIAQLLANGKLAELGEKYGVDVIK